MSDLITEVNRLADYKTRLYNRLVAQGDTVIQPNDSMDTYISRYERLKVINNQSITITENGDYRATGTYTGLNNITVNVPAGGAPTHKLYQLLDRISDDDDNEIGTVSGFFTDGNGVEYAVVCLDSTYRLPNAKWLSGNVLLPNLPSYNNWTLWEAKGTATFNTQKIIDFCESSSYTSDAASHCRSKSFVINGVTYYGQLPNIIELVDIAKNRNAINSADTSGGSLANYSKYWSSSQYNDNSVWGMSANGYVYNYSKNAEFSVCPVLEIPNVLA